MSRSVTVMGGLYDFVVVENLCFDIELTLYELFYIRAIPVCYYGSHGGSGCF